MRVILFVTFLALKKERNLCGRRKDSNRKAHVEREPWGSMQARPSSGWEHLLPGWSPQALLLI